MINYKKDLEGHNNIGQPVHPAQNQGWNQQQQNQGYHNNQPQNQGYNQGGYQPQPYNQGKLIIKLRIQQQCPPKLWRATTNDARSATPSQPKSRYSMHNSDKIIIVREHSSMPCRMCGFDGMSTWRQSAGCATYSWCICLFCFFWPLFWLPFCMDSCYDTEVVCSRCGQMKANIPADCCWNQSS